MHLSWVKLAPMQLCDICALRHCYRLQFVFLYFYRIQVRSLPCLVTPSPTFFNFVQIVGFVKVATWISLSCYTDFSKIIHRFSKLLHGFVKIYTWISLSCYMDLSKLLKMDLFKLLHGFVKVVPCFSRPLSNNIKLKFDHDVKACYKYNLEMFVFLFWCIYGTA